MSREGCEDGKGNSTRQNLWRNSKFICMWPFSEPKKNKEPWEDKFAAFAPLVMASLQVMGSTRLPICFAYRTHPNNQYDSGWVFWSGKETQEFLSETDNSKICPLKSFIEMDSSLLDIINQPLGSVWERDDGKSAWKQVFDYEIPDFKERRAS